MQTRRIPVGGLIKIIVLAGILGESTYAESTPEQDRQQMEQMMEMMKNSGVDPSQLKQVEAMMRGGMETGIRQKEERIDADRAEFAENFGTAANATITINGHRDDLVVTKCEWIDERSESFVITAEKEPGKDRATLMIDGGGRYGAKKLYFHTAHGEVDGQLVDLSFDGERFDWSGTVYDMFVEISVECE